MTANCEGREQAAIRSETRVAFEIGLPSDVLNFLDCQIMPKSCETPFDYWLSLDIVTGLSANR